MTSGKAAAKLVTDDCGPDTKQTRAGKPLLPAKNFYSSSASSELEYTIIYIALIVSKRQAVASVATKCKNNWQYFRLCLHPLLEMRLFSMRKEALFS